MGQRKVTQQELRTYVKIQYEEIEKYRWTESKNRGVEDIGKKTAQEEWISKFAKKFREYWEVDHPIVFLVCTKKETDHINKKVCICLECPYCHYVIKGKSIEGKIIIEDTEHNSDKIEKPQWCKLSNETKKN